MRVCERVFSVGFGPGLDLMSPARSRRSASHVAGFPKKLGGRDPERRDRWIQFAQSPRLWHTSHDQAVSAWCCCCCMPFSTILVVNPGSPGLGSSVLVLS